MHIKVVDGKPIFAKRLIKINTSDIEKYISIKSIYRNPVEQNGEISCYTIEEFDGIANLLDQLGIKYKQSILNDQLADEVDNIKYHNRSEIIEQLQKNIVPKAKEEVNLKKRVDELERKVEILMEKLSEK